MGQQSSGRGVWWQNRGRARVSALVNVAGTRPRAPGHPAQECSCLPHLREGWRPQTPRAGRPGQAGEQARSPELLTAGRKGAPAASPSTGATAAAARAPQPPAHPETPAARFPRRPSPRARPEQPPPGLARPPGSPRLPAAAPRGEGGRADWRRCVLVTPGSAAPAPPPARPAPLRPAAAAAVGVRGAGALRPFRSRSLRRRRRPPPGLTDPRADQSARGERSRRGQWRLGDGPLEGSAAEGGRGPGAGGRVGRPRS
ncbi:hypothetical protein H8959_021034 [Pygathrix nigripes]